MLFRPCIFTLRMALHSQLLSLEQAASSICLSDFTKRLHAHLPRPPSLPNLSTPTSGISSWSNRWTASSNPQETAEAILIKSVIYFIFSLFLFFNLAAGERSGLVIDVTVSKPETGSYNRCRGPLKPFSSASAVALICVSGQDSPSTCGFVVTVFVALFALKTSTCVFNWNHTFICSYSALDAVFLSKPGITCMFQHTKTEESHLSPSIINLKCLSNAVVYYLKSEYGLNCWVVSKVP